MAARYPSNGDRQIFTKPTIRLSGGDTPPITKDVILRQMELFHPGWRSQTLTIPCIPDLKYEGPTDFPGLEEKMEKSHQGHVKGQENEAKVLKTLQEFSRSNNRHWKIFNNVEVKDLKCVELANIFGRNFPSNPRAILKGQLEIDVVVVDGSNIILTEVKSKLTDPRVAITQLKKAKEFTLKLLQIIGVSSKVQITKVIAAPGPFIDLAMKMARDEECLLLKIDDNKNHQTLHSIGFPKRKTDIDELIAVLTFLKCCTKHQSFDENKLRLSMLEGAKGKERSVSLTHHNSLEKWNHPDVEYSKDLYIWLDPDQAKVMNHPYHLQIIIGPASTGKTILIQLKILEMLKKNENVLVILPSSTLVSKYQSFFENNITEKLNIVTPGADWQSILQKTEAHLFVDEFCA